LGEVGFRNVVKLMTSGAIVKSELSGRRSKERLIIIKCRLIDWIGDIDKNDVQLNPNSTIPVTHK